MVRFMVSASYPAFLESIGMDRSAAERLVKKDLDATHGPREADLEPGAA